MKHYYENVPRLGNVAVSRHAQSQMLEAGISQEAFDRALLDPTQPDAPDEQDVLWRVRPGAYCYSSPEPRLCGPRSPARADSPLNSQSLRRYLCQGRQSSWLDSDRCGKSA